MSTEMWTIIGVVLGTILGGVVQIVAGTVQRRSERADRLRELRRSAYVEFLSAMGQMETLNIAFTVKNPSLDEVKGARAVVDSWKLITNALASVQLVAPEDTFKAASTYASLVGTHNEGREEDARKARQAFAALTLRDLR